MLTQYGMCAERRRDFFFFVLLLLSLDDFQMDIMDGTSMGFGMKWQGAQLCTSCWGMDVAMSRLVNDVTGTVRVRSA